MRFDIAGTGTGRQALVVLAHGIVGWAWCGALIGIGRQLFSMEAALIIHAIGGPLGFSLIAWFYFRRFGYTTPLQTAAAFLGVVVTLDLLLVAPVFEGSYAMFTSTLGTWLPFALIFTAVNVTGQLAAGRGVSR
ncbi:MAG: hypothetical protein V3W14_08340 [Candidatus Neomarinimicrobiota bacterium]